MRIVFAAVLAAALAVAPGLALAAAGDGASFGSRGSLTYSAPPRTNTAPFGAAPLQRSLTPQPGPSYAAPGFAPAFGYGGHSPFLSGLMGGLIGAGLAGMLFGHGLFWGISGFGSVLGLLLQIVLVVMVARWLLRRLFGAPVLAGGGMAGRMGMGGPALGGPMSAYGGAPVRRIQISDHDFVAFERLLKTVQAAWSDHDLATLRAVASPEMVSYFAEQLSEQTSRGLRNTVTDVHLEQGDLAEAWAEPGREYATVAMRFSMNDVTRDRFGNVVDGSVSERVLVAEIWTFMRAPGGRWILSAIQQAR